MRYLIYILLSVLLVGCGAITRMERDEFTITTKDTLVTTTVANVPGERNNGIIFPSSKSVVVQRELLQHDSIVIREYPAFIRMGIFEAVGIRAFGQPGASTHAGLFGIFPEVDKLLFSKPNADTSAAFFTGGIYRLGVMEWPLHWFNGAKDWSWGITALELVRPTTDSRTWLTGTSLFSLQKRYYLKDDVVRIAITPFARFSVAPSAYIHTGASIDVGSVGGLNVRGFVGYAFGLTSLSSGSFVSAPYIGIGASVLDFVNHENELSVEWKDHQHSSFEVGAGGFLLLGSNQDISFWAPSKPLAEQPIITGFIMNLANARVSLPFLDRRFTLGTSLINLVALGNSEFGIGILPIRAGYNWSPFNNQFTVEPFIEYNYAPSQFFHTGVRGVVPVIHQVSIQAMAGFVTGNTLSNRALGLGNSVATGNPTAFSGYYFGIGANIFTSFFRLDELR